MAGGMRYGGKCKVGNWNESATLDEVRFRANKFFTRSRSTGFPSARRSPDFSHPRFLARRRFAPRSTSPRSRPAR